MERRLVELPLRASCGLTGPMSLSLIGGQRKSCPKLGSWHANLA